MTGNGVRSPRPHTAQQELDTAGVEQIKVSARNNWSRPPAPQRAKRGGDNTSLSPVTITDPPNRSPTPTTHTHSDASAQQQRPPQPPQTTKPHTYRTSMIIGTGGVARQTSGRRSARLFCLFLWDVCGWCLFRAGNILYAHRGRGRQRLTRDSGITVRACGDRGRGSGHGIDRAGSRRGKARALAPICGCCGRCAVVLVRGRARLLPSGGWAAGAGLGARLVVLGYLVVWILLGIRRMSAVTSLQLYRMATGLVGLLQWCQSISWAPILRAVLVVLVSSSGSNPVGW